MAKIIGDPGGSVSRRDIGKLKRVFLLSALGMGVLGIITGGSICAALLAHLLPFVSFIVEVSLFGIATYFIAQATTRSIHLYEQKRINWRKATLGEAAVGYILEDLPDDYVVFNDLSTLSSKINHVVIGPAGVFVIGTKNWRGTATPDGRGELLCNGKPAGCCEVSDLLDSIKGLREKINFLTRRDDFIQGILAFPLARVETTWGMTRNIHCLPDDKLLDTIQKYSFSGRLKKNEIELIEKAFQALACAESGFDPTAIGLTIIPACLPRPSRSQ